MFKFAFLRVGFFKEDSTKYRVNNERDNNNKTKSRGVLITSRFVFEKHEGIGKRENQIDTEKGNKKFSVKLNEK